jgi:hypothetical protein
LKRVIARAELGRHELITAARAAFELGQSLDWKSHDPYDVLLSPFARPLRTAWPLGARILLQIGKRSGRRFRTLLRVPAHEEPKALADFLLAGAILARQGEEWAAEYAQELPRRLERAAVRNPAGHGWGLQLPWVSRFGRIDAGEPNNYTTTAVCQALLAGYEVWGRQASLDAALAGVAFILDGLGAMTHRGRQWLRYTKTSQSPIINIQASSASLLTRAASHSGEQRLLDAADQAAEAVIASQGQHGEWTYSDDGRGRFIDGFHTGFTLQGLQEYTALRGEHAVAGTLPAIESGFHYFKHHLLASDGRPRDFADGQVSLDGQTLGQAVQTLVVCGGADDSDLAFRNCRLALERFQLKKVHFPLLRWSVGPALLATAFVVRALDDLPPGDDRASGGS